MKSLFYTFAFVLFSLNAFSQSITLYGLKGVGDPMNIDSYAMDLVQIDPYSGSITSLFEIPNSYAVAAGSSTFDHVNGTFIYWGPDDQQDYRLFSVDVDDQTSLLAPITTERAIELEFDLETGITYGLLYDEVTDIGSFGTVDLLDGSSNTIGTITGLEAIAIGSSTYDSNNKRYIFYGVDTSFDFRLYTVDVSTGEVLSSPIINPNTTSERISFFEYDNNSDKLYSIYSEVDSMMYDSFDQMDYRKMYLSEVDLVTGTPTILGTTPILEGYFSGIQVGGVAYDQASRSYVMRGSDDTGFKLLIISTINGAVISSIASPENFGEIQVDNIGFATAFYAPTSNEENEKLEAINFFPNPVSDRINLEIKTTEIADLEIRILDVLGRMVYQNNFDIDNSNQTLTIPTSQLTPGNYLISIRSEAGGLRTEKFVKE